MHVIGTAGHVDHGKSALVQALTGMNPDRLREEQERQMTIDLGFAWFELGEGDEVGIVDVPGHRDFIENMLAGVGGIDAAVLVVAADEGVMPQTKEHLAILDLLEVDRGLVAVSKVDLVEEEDWLMLVEQDVRKLLSGTRLAKIPMVRTSAKTGQGIEAFRQALSDVLAEGRSREENGQPRLPIDRVFSISGFGTVVTGTLQGGNLRVGEEVQVLPAGTAARLRGLQTHKKKVERAAPGSRVAANLSGVEVAEVARGDVVVRPGAFEPTNMIDVSFRLLPDADFVVRHNQEFKLFLGPAQRLVRVRLLVHESLRPGESGWLQLLLNEPVVAARGDRFILRRPSPPQTLGGGQVADPHPARRHRLKDAAIPRRLKRLLHGAPVEVLIETVRASGPMTLADALSIAGLDGELAELATREAADRDAIWLVEATGAGGRQGSIAVERSWWRAQRSRIQALLRAYHRQHPLRGGMPSQELKSRLGVTASVFGALLHQAEKETWARLEGTQVRLTDHRVQLSAEQRRRKQALLDAFAQAPTSPPSVKEAIAEVGVELYLHMLEREELIQVSPDVVFTRQAYAEMVSQVRRLIQRKGQASIAEIRDELETSRKYTLGLMEHLDQQGITVRRGDFRELIRSG